SEIVTGDAGTLQLQTFRTVVHPSQQRPGFARHIAPVQIVLVEIRARNDDDQLQQESQQGRDRQPQRDSAHEAWPHAGWQHHCCSSSTRRYPTPRTVSIAIPELASLNAFRRRDTSASTALGESSRLNCE